MLTRQRRQARPLGQRHDRHQASPRHQIRVIKRRVDLSRSCNNRTCEVSSRSEHGSFSNSHRPSSEGTFRVDAPNEPLFTRWIEAKRLLLRPDGGLILELSHS